MAEGKKGFMLYADQYEIFKQLPDDIAGKLIKHIFEYVNDKDPQTDDLILKLAFTPIKNQLKRDLKKWEKQYRQRVEAGKRSAEIRKRNATTVNERSISSTDNVNVNVNVNDNVKVNNNISQEIKDFSDELIKNYFNEDIYPKSRKSSYDAIDKLIRIDKLQKEVIEEIVKATRNDKFWTNNFLSLAKLRQKNKEGIEYWKVWGTKLVNTQKANQPTIHDFSSLDGLF